MSEMVIRVNVVSLRHDGAMTTSQKSSMVRRVAVAILVVVLLPMLYVASAMCLVYASRAGWLSVAVDRSPIAEAYLTPLQSYCDSGAPGARLCKEQMQTTKAAGYHQGRIGR